VSQPLSLQLLSITFLFKLPVIGLRPSTRNIKGSREVAGTHLRSTSSLDQLQRSRIFDSLVRCGRDHLPLASPPPYTLAEEKRIFRFEVGNGLPASRHYDLRSRLMNILRPTSPVVQDTRPCSLSIRHQRSYPSQTCCVEYESARKGTTRIKIPPIKRE